MQTHQSQFYKKYLLFWNGTTIILNAPLKANGRGGGAGVMDVFYSLPPPMHGRGENGFASIPMGYPRPKPGFCESLPVLSMQSYHMHPKVTLLKIITQERTSKMTGAMKKKKMKSFPCSESHLYMCSSSKRKLKGDLITIYKGLHWDTDRSPVFFLPAIKEPTLGSWS